MADGTFRFETPVNEPVLSYRAGSPERAEAKARLAELKSAEVEIPLVIGGREVRTGNLADCRPPHEHAHKLGVYHKASPEEVSAAIAAATEAREDWASRPWEERLAVFRKAADLLAGPHRALLNAATMLGQSKNVFQAEIDAACELIDFFRFNAYYVTQLYAEQPFSPRGFWNRMEYRPLEGFVFAVTPFNFTSIAGNLPTAPAMLGNTVLWKPASSAVYSAWYLMRLLEEAGLPPGVINFIPGAGSEVGPAALASEHLAGVHFTGSTDTFRGMWKSIGGRIDGYRSYPRIVGETGGKDFVFVHRSAGADAVATALVRGAFEYQGQKCSAASRCYVPDCLWDEVREKLLADVATIKTGGVEDFTNFMNATIDRPAFEKIREYIEFARSAPDAEVICGGGCDDATGYFVEPTVIVAAKPDFRTMAEEIFGPVLTVYVYKADRFEETLEVCDRTSPYALTGSIFARDRAAVATASRALRGAAGNFYVNDKPTAAVVGQQPFGGARASGTNDKAGSILNLIRWTSPRAIKETFVSPTDYRYPFMEEA
ncbi:MAG: L-glutamate gamma-semialdehyde dehydrogenase [Planctomycetota bacterium]|jgi:1-pyrroline-5-carboxylate dehydrogenase